MSTLTQRPAWRRLAEHHQQLQGVSLKELFAQDAGRGERLTAEGGGLFLDYSKNRVTDETLRLLIGLAEDCGLRQRVDAMFRGEKINRS